MKNGDEEGSDNYKMSWYDDNNWDRYVEKFAVFRFLDLAVTESIFIFKA